MNSVAKIRFFFITSLIGVVFFSCNPDEEFPPETILEWVGVTFFGDTTRLDSISLRIAYQDGDGNIGISRSESGRPPFVGKFAHNFIVHPYNKINDTTYEIIKLQSLDSLKQPIHGVFDTIEFRHIIPPLPQTRTGAVRGTFDFMVPPGDFGLIRLDALQNLGIIRFKIYVYDRSLYLASVRTPDGQIHDGPLITPDIIIR